MFKVHINSIKQKFSITRRMSRILEIYKNLLCEFLKSFPKRISTILIKIAFQILKSCNAKYEMILKSTTNVYIYP